MKRSILVVCLSLFAADASAASLQLSDAWIRLLPAGVPAAGYFAVRNDGRAPAQLVAATSPAFGEVMFHKSKEEKGRSTMVHLDKVDVPSGGEVVSDRLLADRLLVHQPALGSTAKVRHTQRIDHQIPSHAYLHWGEPTCLRSLNAIGTTASVT